MHELALQNFEDAGFLQPEYVGDGGTIVTFFDGNIREIPVEHKKSFKDRGELYWPVNKRDEIVLLDCALSSMGG